MHERHRLEKELRKDAERVSKKYGGAPVIVILAGSAEADVSRTMIASTLHQPGDRLRDLLGILQTAIQIETLKHFQPPKAKDESARRAAQATEAIRRKLEQSGGRAWIPKLTSGTFLAELQEDGLRVDNLGSQPFLPWAVFEEAVLLLIRNDGCAARGDALQARLGEEKLPLDSVEGHIAHTIYGKQPGDSVFRRITPLSCTLIWAGICEHAPGQLVLKDW